MPGGAKLPEEGLPPSEPKLPDCGPFVGGPKLLEAEAKLPGVPAKLPGAPAKLPGAPTKFPGGPDDCAGLAFPNKLAAP